MRIERSKYSSPPSPVETFRSLSLKITGKPNYSNDGSNHRLLDRSSWDKSDDQNEDEDILPFTTGKFTRKTTPLSPLSTLKSPKYMKKALISRVNAAVDHKLVNNSYFGNQDSRDDDESHQYLLERDGQSADRWSRNDSDDNYGYAMKKNQNENVTGNAPLIPDLVDLGGFGDSSESMETNKENKCGFTKAPNPSIAASEEERDGTSNGPSESFMYSFDSRDGVDRRAPQVEGGDEEIMESSSTIDLDEVIDEEEEAKGDADGGDAITTIEANHISHAVVKLSSQGLSYNVLKNEEDEVCDEEPRPFVANDLLMGSSSTVDLDDDLSLAKTVTLETPVGEQSGKKSIGSSPTDIASYASYTRRQCPVVVSSSQHGDVILLSPKGSSTSAKATLLIPSFEEEDEVQDLSSKFNAVAMEDPSVDRRNRVAENEQTNTDQKKTSDVDSNTDNDDDDDEFVISDDWSENDSISNTSDPFGECIVNKDVVQNITRKRLEDFASFLGRDKQHEEKVQDKNALTQNDSTSEVASISETSSTLSDFETNQLANKTLSDSEINQLANRSNSSIDLASFNQIWEESTSKISEDSDSGSDSDECEESKLGDNKCNDDVVSAASHEDTIQSLVQQLSVSKSSEENSDSSGSVNKNSFETLFNYWEREWTDLTSDDSNNGTSQERSVQVSLKEDGANSVSSGDEEIGVYVTANEVREDSDEFFMTGGEDDLDADRFYGCGIVEGSGDYSYDSYGLETISEEGEDDEDESAVPLTYVDSMKDEVLVQTLLSEDEEKEEEEGGLGTNEEELLPENTDEMVVESVKECISDILCAEPSIFSRQEEVIAVKSLDECSSVEEVSKVDELVTQKISTPNGVVEESQFNPLHELWSKIDEYHSSGNIIEVFEHRIQQSLSTKTIVPVKKRTAAKHTLADIRRSSSQLGKKAAKMDATFEDLSRFLDSDEKKESSFVADPDTSVNSSESFEDNEKIQRATVRRHVFTKLFSPVSALINRRSSSSMEASKSEYGTDNLEVCKLENAVETEDDREARELAEILTAALMAQEQENIERAAAEAKKLTEIQHAAAMEQELAEIEGSAVVKSSFFNSKDPHDAVTVEACSLDGDDESQIEIIDEEQVTVAPPSTADSSGKSESKNLTELLFEIDKFQASGESMDTSQVAIMVKILNSEIDEYQIEKTTGVTKISTPRFRSSKRVVAPIKKRAVANVKAKKTKYDLAYIEAFSNGKNQKAAGDDAACEDLISIIVEQSHPEIKTQPTYESDDSQNLITLGAAKSLDSFASMLSAGKSSGSLDGVVSKDGSELSKNSIVSKLYSDNTTLAENLASMQCELEKAMKQLERMKMEREELIEKKVYPETPTDPRSSFDEYFEPNSFDEDYDDNEWYGRYGPDCDDTPYLSEL